MIFKFEDSIELGRNSRYYIWLQKNKCRNIATKDLKLNYLLEHGYRKKPDSSGERDYISEDQFGDLLYLEQLYHDDFLRPGCDRFWTKEFNKIRYRFRNEHK